MKKCLMQLVCIVLTTLMITGLFSVDCFADEERLISGTFNCMVSYGNEIATEQYYYSDDYFLIPSTRQNEHLTTMSMALALSAMDSKGSSFVSTLLQEIGYRDIRIDDMNTTPTKDTIGTAIAHKRIGNNDVVAVSVRGNKYGAEWASNLTAGSSGDIEGFASAADKVIARLKAYIAEYDLKNVKLWIAGYSRAGAVSDLAGVYINEHQDEFDTTTDDIYVYTFAAPHCSASDKVYENIYCIRNKNDIVTYLYPQSWGLYSNGVEILIGEDRTVSRKTVDIFQSDPMIDIGECDMEDFIVEFTVFFAENMSREQFAGDFDDSVAELLELYFSKPQEEWQPTFDYLKNEYFGKLKSNDRFFYTVISQVIGGIMKHNSDKMYMQLTDEFLLVLDETTSAEELHLSEQEYQMIRDRIYPILRTIGPVFVKDYYYRTNVDYSKVLPEDYDDPDYDPQNSKNKVLTYNQVFKPTQPLKGDAVCSYGTAGCQTLSSTHDDDAISSEELRLYHFGTFFGNLLAIISEHYPYINWKYVTAMDSYYTRDSQPPKKNTPDSADTPDSPDNSDKTSYVLGDIDGDEKVTAKDSMIIQRYVINLKLLDSVQLKAADVNGDEKVTNKDALEILRYTLHMSNSKTIGQKIA